MPTRFYIFTTCVALLLGRVCSAGIAGTTHIPSGAYSTHGEIVRPDAAQGDDVNTAVDKFVGLLKTGQMTAAQATKASQLLGVPKRLLESIEKALPNIESSDTRATLQETLIRLKYEEEWRKLSVEELRHMKEELVVGSSSNNLEIPAAQSRVINSLIKEKGGDLHPDPNALKGFLKDLENRGPGR